MRTASVGDFTRAVIDVGRQPLILMTSLAQAAQFVLNGTLNAFLPLFARDELGLSPSDLGWLFALQTITTLAARPAIGILSDRVGRRGVIVVGLVVCCGAVLLISTASSLRTLVIAIVTYAVGVAVTTSATSAFITDLSRGDRYGTAHGVFGTIYDIGMFRIMAAVTLGVTGTFYLASRRAHVE